MIIIYGLIVLFITLFFIVDQWTRKARIILTKLLLVWSSFLTIATFVLLIALGMQPAELDKELRDQIKNEYKYKVELIAAQKAALCYADSVLYTHKLYDNEYVIPANYRFWREKVDSLSELDRKQRETW